MTDPQQTVGNPLATGGILNYESQQVVPKHGGLLGWGIALVVLGALNLLLALLIFAMPMGLFILGGGGNTDAFGELTARFALFALVALVPGILMLVSGIVMLVVRRRKRRAALQSSS